MLGGGKNFDATVGSKQCEKLMVFFYTMQIHSSTRVFLTAHIVRSELVSSESSILLVTQGAIKPIIDCLESVTKKL